MNPTYPCSRNALGIPMTVMNRTAFLSKATAWSLTSREKSESAQ